MESKNLIIHETVSDCTLFEWEKKDYFQEASPCPGIGTMRNRKEYVVRTQEPDKLQFTIVYREEDKPIGRIYISRIDRQADSWILLGYISEKRSIWAKGWAKAIPYFGILFIQLHMER